MSNTDAPLDVGEFRTAVEAFKRGWATADALGMDGHRTEVGLLYALRHLPEATAPPVITINNTLTDLTALQGEISAIAAVIAELADTAPSEVSVEQRDVMDESDKSDRLDNDGDRVRWSADKGEWEYCDRTNQRWAYWGNSLAGTAQHWGPLTFAGDTAPDPTPERDVMDEDDKSTRLTRPGPDLPAYPVVWNGWEWAVDGDDWAYEHDTLQSVVGAGWGPLTFKPEAE